MHDQCRTQQWTRMWPTGRIIDLLRTADRWLKWCVKSNWPLWKQTLTVIAECVDSSAKRTSENVYDRPNAMHILHGAQRKNPRPRSPHTNTHPSSIQIHRRGGHTSRRIIFYLHKVIRLHGGIFQLFNIYIQILLFMFTFIPFSMSLFHLTGNLFVYTQK